MKQARYHPVPGEYYCMMNNVQDQQWFEWAWQLQGTQNELFWDDESGGYFSSTAQDPSILLRVKEG